MADKYNLQNINTFQAIMKLPKYTKEGFNLYDKYVNSRTSIKNYQNNFLLPVIFMPEPIPLVLRDIQIFEPKKGKFKKI